MGAGAGGGRGRAAPRSVPAPRRSGGARPAADGEASGGRRAHGPIGRRVAGGRPGRRATSPAGVVGAGSGFASAPPRDLSAGGGPRHTVLQTGGLLGRLGKKFFVKQQMFRIKFPFSPSSSGGLKGGRHCRTPTCVPDFQLGAPISAPDVLLDQIQPHLPKLGVWSQTQEAGERPGWARTPGTEGGELKCAGGPSR